MDAPITHAAGPDAGHSEPHFNAWTILVVLVVLTAVSWGSDLLHIGGTFFFLAVAAAKAFFVMAFFMHLLYEKRWKWVLIVPPIVMAILMVMALVPDVVHHR